MKEHTWNWVVSKKCANKTKHFRFFKGAAFCSDDSFCRLLASFQPPSWGRHLECFSGGLERAPVYSESLVDCFSFTLQFISFQNIYIGFRSGDWGGQVTWYNTPSLSVLVEMWSLEVCFGCLSCWCDLKFISFIFVVVVVCLFFYGDGVISQY